jgi:hypothetical protein
MARVARMAMALRKVSAPVTRSRTATLGMEKKLMGKSSKTDPEWGPMLHCDIMGLEGAFK